MTPVVQVGAEPDGGAHRRGGQVQREQAGDREVLVAAAVRAARPPRRRRRRRAREQHRLDGDVRELHRLAGDVDEVAPVTTATSRRRLTSGSPPRCVEGFVLIPRLGRVAGQREEDVVERRLVHLRRRRRLRPPRRGRARPSVARPAPLGPGRAGAGRRGSTSTAPSTNGVSARRRRVGGGERDLEPGAAGLRLQLGGGPLGDRPAVVDDDDPVGELVGLVQVLGGEQQRGAVATSSRITSHMRTRLVGSSPVVGSSRKRTGGRVTMLAARSSRRRMPPEYS